MPRLVILNAGPDTAGCGIGLKRAFDKYAVAWETRAVCRDTTYLDYPTDILWPYTEFGVIHREVRQLVHDADVVHVMDSEAALYPFRKLLKGKRIVVHHLGTHFRRNPQRASARSSSFGAIEVTDSIDLIRPHVRFLPVPIDVEAMQKLRLQRDAVPDPAVRAKDQRADGAGDGPLADVPVRHLSPAQGSAVALGVAGVPNEFHGVDGTAIRIAHAPTRREVKSTETIIAAVERLAKRYAIEFDLIEGVSNRECIERKARADIFVDQLTLGFGMNAIECWAMGIPVVSGLSDATALHRGVEMWGELPWVNTWAGELEAVIEYFVTHPGMRVRKAEQALAHVQRWHSQEAVVRQTLAVYDSSVAEAVA